MLPVQTTQTRLYELLKGTNPNLAQFRPQNPLSALQAASLNSLLPPIPFGMNPALIPGFPYYPGLMPHPGAMTVFNMLQMKQAALLRDEFQRQAVTIATSLKKAKGDLIARQIAKPIRQEPQTVEIKQDPEFEKSVEDEGELENDDLALDPKSKKIKKINTCGHDDRKHYAKGMCNPCYHKFGRVKKPWKCDHDKLYAHGLCQVCYIAHYNKKRLGRRYKNYRRTKRRTVKKLAKTEPVVETVDNIETVEQVESQETQETTETQGVSESQVVVVEIPAECQMMEEKSIQSPKQNSI